MIRVLLILVFVVSLGPVSAQDNVGTEDQDTIVTSDYLEMTSGDEISEFHFAGNVTVAGTNLNLTSDDLLITAVKKGEKDATVSEMGKIIKIVATGDVNLIQAARSAKSGRAEFFPEEKRVVLTENPVITDQGRTVSGDRISWFHGDRRAQVEGGDSQKVIVTLPSMPNLGYDPNAEEKDSDSDEENESEDNPSESSRNP